MLFRIAGTEVQIVGSLHFLPTTDSELPAAYSSAVASSDELIFESDFENQRFPDIALVKQLPLVNSIPPDLYARAAALWLGVGIAESIDLFKAWFVALRLGIAIQAFAGADPSRGVDRQLALRARELGKPRYVLEGPEVLRYFDEAPATEITRFLDFVVSDPEANIVRFHSLVKAWRELDFALIDNVFAPFVEMFPVTHTRLISARNQAWLPSFLKAVSERRRALFVVGCAHLKHGPESCERLLQQYGLSLVQAG